MQLYLDGVFEARPPFSWPTHLQKATSHAQRAALQEHEAYTWDSDRLAAPSPLPPTLHDIRLNVHGSRWAGHSSDCERRAGEWIDYSMCLNARVIIGAFSFRKRNPRIRAYELRAHKANKQS